MNSKFLVKIIIITITYFMSLPTFAQWKPFKWGAVATGSKSIRKGSILLPVTLDGTSCEMQLDTGAGISILYRNALPKRYSNLLKSKNILIENFSLAGQSTQLFQLMYSGTGNNSEKCGILKDNILVGTIANDYFLNGNLSLDLSRNLFRYESVPFSPLAGKSYTYFNIEVSEIESYGSFPLVDIILKNGDKKKMVFDTGSASASIVISKERDWLDLVELSKIDDVKPEFISRWGKKIPCYSAPIVQPIAMGEFVLSLNTNAVYCHDPRANQNGGSPFFGLIGLKPFDDNIITIDYISKKIFIEKY